MEMFREYDSHGSILYTFVIRFLKIIKFITLRFEELIYIVTQKEKWGVKFKMKP